MPGFRYDEAITGRFPGAVGGVIHALGVRNGPAPRALSAAYRDEQAEIAARLVGTSLSELPTLAAWRSTFRAFGVDPTQYRSAAEALTAAAHRWGLRHAAKPLFVAVHEQDVARSGPQPAQCTHQCARAAWAFVLGAMPKSALHSMPCRASSRRMSAK